MIARFLSWLVKRVYEKQVSLTADAIIAETYRREIDEKATDQFWKDVKTELERRMGEE